METVQIQLPTMLLKEIKQELPSEEALNQIFVEAIEIWLETHKKRGEEKAGLQMLREAGLVMTAERQRAFADAIIDTIDSKDSPNLADIQASLAKLKVPISEEIVAMRRER